MKHIKFALKTNGSYVPLTLERARCSIVLKTQTKRMGFDNISTLWLY
jgi:hypothetical protein